MPTPASSPITFNVDHALEQIAALVKEHGPQAVETASRVVQINAVNNIIGGLGFAALAAVGFLLCRWLFKQTKTESKSYVDDHFGYWLGLGLTTAATTLFSIIAFSGLLDAWVWIALFNPKLALAHEILKRIAGVS